MTAPVTAKPAPEFPMRVPDDLPAAYPWWGPEEWSS